MTTAVVQEGEEAIGQQPITTELLEVATGTSSTTSGKKKKLRTRGIADDHSSSLRKVHRMRKSHGQSVARTELFHGHLLFFGKLFHDHLGSGIRKDVFVLPLLLL